MDNLRCCIIGCNKKDILSVCKTCKIFFCFNHRNLIDCHEIINGFSVFNRYHCCNYCCNRHFYVQCSTCDDMIINTMSIQKNNNTICKYPCFKYKNNI